MGKLEFRYAYLGLMSLIDIFPQSPTIHTRNLSDMPKLKKTLLMKKQILLGKRKKLLKKE